MQCLDKHLIGKVKGRSVRGEPKPFTASNMVKALGAVPPVVVEMKAGTKQVSLSRMS